jgi:hypothetical protein
MIYRSPEEMKDLISQLDDKGNDFWDAELARVKLDILRQASVQPKAVDMPCKRNSTVSAVEQQPLRKD